MKIYSNGKDRTLTGSFPARFKLLNNGVEVPFIRTGKGSVRLSGEIPFGELDVEEVIKQKTPQPAKLDAQSVAIINKADFDQIDILSKKLAINQEQMNAHLSSLTEHEATLANLETQNAQAIEQVNVGMAEMAGVFGKEIQSDRERIKATAKSIAQDIAVSSKVLNAKIEAHEKAKNPHKITKETIGLDKVENTSDLDKPVSKATQKALDKKADKSDIEDVRKEIKATEKKQERLVKSIDNANLYGGIGGNELPTGGKKGQVLSKGSNKTGDYKWIDNSGSPTWGNIGGNINNQTDLKNALDAKQDVISDLDTIRSGASAGATAVQPDDVGNATLTIQKNGSSEGTFTANSKTDTTINISVPTDTNDLTNGAGYITGITSGDVTTALGYTPYNSSNPDDYQTGQEVASAVSTETTNRENADIALQQQIDAIVSSSDVFDIVGTYAELQSYDISTVPVNDIIKVLVDSTHDNAATYYRCVENDNVKSWSYIGSEGAYYTKGEADGLFVPQTRTVNGKALSSDITLNASDVGAQPAGNYVTTDTVQTINQAAVKTFNGRVNFVGAGDSNAIYLSTDTRIDVYGTSRTVLGFASGTFLINNAAYPLNLRGSGTRPAWNSTSYLALTSDIGNATLTIQKNGVAVDTFTANATSDKTINITVPTSAADVSALPSSTKYGADLSYSSNTLQLKDQDGNNLGSPVTISGVAGADTDLSNLTSTGKNIGNWSSNVTNCITEIPQDINLTLSSGTLTLKAGSKVYVPNGSGTFNTITIASDKTITSTLTARQAFVVYRTTQNAIAITSGIANVKSGTTTPSTGWYYNTTDNKIYRDTNDEGISFPIAIVTLDGTAIKSIDQVFNGFGYIGSTIFALPGIKGLVPNGRNDDGTLKNTAFTRTSVTIATQTNVSNKGMTLLSNALAFGGTSVFEYNEEENKNYSGGNVTTTCAVGTYDRTNGVVSNFHIKPTFHAVDYNDAIIKDANNTFTGSNTFSGAVSLGGSATATTPAYSDNNTSVATTAWGYSMLNAQRTNCITNIPQDIKLELSSGTLTLKSGSKVYVPNGSGVFDAVTTSSDKTVSVSGSSTFDCVIYYATHDNNLRYGTLSQSVSGSSLSITDGYWYDTTNNIIKRIVNSAVSYSGLSFPIAIVSVVSGVITSINQIFNGFGYMGSVVFGLPNVEGLIPNGRNADGTLKSTKFKISSVITSTLNSGYEDAYVRAIGFGWSYEYDEYRNLVHLASDKNSIRDFAYLGKYKIKDGKILYFTPKTAFHALDWNDLKYGTNFRTVIETYKNGTNWYRIWSDGWIEQGGTASGNTSITLLKQMSDDTYCITLSGKSTGYVYAIDSNTKTSTGFNIYSFNSRETYWMVCGY